MERVQINNLGIPPLAGLSSYEDACKPGYSVDHNVELLKRYNYAESRLNQIFAAHLPSTPEWEVKCAFSLYMWQDADHSAQLRKRVSEMREPPLQLDRVPDPKLQKFFDEVIRAENTVELLVGIFRVVKPELIRSFQKHLSETNPIIDHPTCRVLKNLLREEEEMVAWGEAAIEALTETEYSRRNAVEWEAHLRSFLHHCSGISGDLAAPEGFALPQARSDGSEYIMDLIPQRDSRFIDQFNQSALIDQYYRDETLDYDERTYALLYKRLREMDVPEYMAPFIYNVKDKPWDYYVDQSRQLWDECRHSMMGEIGLYRDGVPFYKYPIDIKTSYNAATKLTQSEAHLNLLGVELGLMAKETGKRYEWIIAQGSCNDFGVACQDYDWADEVLHTQIGRKWLTPVYGSLENIQTMYDQIRPKVLEFYKDASALSDQQEWWSDFIQEIRENRDKLKTAFTNVHNN
ncbi:hypothetical protein [Paenibacillus sp. OV219]|uniref:hypothetical protein n=1 Tax=Paenibacillus sp. OV219 TaxID=1884377 RepID=UPI0008D857F4|nr:hypothetical protein [Paenibacillus sp. OV219]SEO62948.1 hypothetical protein SAMN05518847_10971 [Paenibacillus sp. OV219]